MSRSRPYFAAVTAAVLMATAGIAVTTAAQGQAAPQSCAGAWVVVQPDHDDPSSASITCAPIGAGQTVLEVLSGVHTVVENAYLSPGQIDGLPTDPNWDSNGGFFWAFCTAEPADTLSWGFASDAAGQLTASSSTVYGFMLTDRFSDCAGVSSLPEATTTTTATSSPDVTTTTTTSPSPDVTTTATTSPSPEVTTTTTTSPSPEVTTTTTTSPSPEATATTTATPSAAPSNPPRENAAAAALKAATWLSKNPAEKSDADGLWQDVLGLASVNQCSFEPAIESQVAQLKKLAKDYIASNTAGRAGRLATVAVAVGENPRDFGGVDLVKAILDNTADDGQTDGGGNPFSHSMALIGLARTGASVPPAMITALLGAQGDSGAFGFGSGAGFFPDFDTTGLAIQALYGFRADPAVKAAIDKAVAWALSQQLPSGQWPNDYAPVNSTGLLGSAVDLAGASSGKAVGWMKSQQLANGALPDALDGDEANRFATVEGLFLLSETSYLTVSFTADCADPGTDDDDLPELSDTGASDATGMLGIVAVILVAAGGSLVALRRSRQS